MASQKTSTATTDTFFHWLRTTLANHTTCPYAFAFIGCLLSSSLGRGKECFPRVCQKYFANAACRHLSTMCRMYNDDGLVTHDSEERNLNSVDFPECEMAKGFSPSSPMSCSDCFSPTRHVTGRKEALFKLAQYERQCLNEALSRLEEETKVLFLPGLSSVVRNVETRKMAICRMFCDVTDLYGEIYVVKNIACRMAAKPSVHH